MFPKRLQDISEMVHDQSGADNNELCCISKKSKEEILAWAGFY